MTLPTFLMIGAAKSGTSAVYACFEQHPEIFTSEIKEPGFFALEGKNPHYGGPGDMLGERQRVRTLNRYLDLFRGSAGRPAIGEASNIYLYDHDAPERIRRYVPHAKLIAILRHPVDRAYSGYRHLVRDGREPLSSFEEVLEAEDSRIAANWHPLWHHKQRGYYYRQLKRYFDFFDHRQLAVYLYDDFRADPLGVIQAMFRFVGVDASFVPDMSVKQNVSGTPRSRLLHAMLARPSAVKDLAKPLVPTLLRRRIRAALMERNIVPGEPRMTPAIRQQLTELYADDIRQLAGLLGRDLSSWLATPRVKENQL